MPLEVSGGGVASTPKPKPKPEPKPIQGEPKNDAPFTNPTDDNGNAYTVPGTAGGDLADAVNDALGGGGGGSDGGGSAIDWGGVDFSSYLGVWGLPADVQARVTQIFQQTGDANVAAQLALAYIRGTDWYAATYPGIQQAEAKGLISNEADYRALLNQQTQLYKQYLGRDITTDEFAANLNEGVSYTVIGQRLQGATYAKTYGGDWNYAIGAFGDPGDSTLTDADRTALGQEQAGLDTPLGQLLNKRLSQAQQRLQGVFKGGLATPSMSLAGGRLAGPQAGAPPDTAA